MRIISLFCGAGGLDLGLVKAGHEIIWANDDDADAVATYRKNISNHVICADIIESGGKLHYSDAVRSSSSYSTRPGTINVPQFVTPKAIEWRWRYQ